MSFFHSLYLLAFFSKRIPSSLLYFCFLKALEYHKKDLEIAERLADRPGMAKAFGNLGNTFKSLKNYVNAVRCCEAHLEITRELGDRLGEVRNVGPFV